jgi:hypothetical protein
MNDWEVTIDSIPPESFWLSSRADGGYGITHAGSARTTAGDVNYAKVDDLVAVLTWWLSLLRSERTAAVLIVGVHEGERVWEKWRTPSVAPWFGWRSWLPQVLGSPIEGAPAVDLSPPLTALWNMKSDETEWRASQRAVDWYTQSIQSTHLATTVVLAQAGLELLSWFRLVSDKVLREDAFGKLEAADALRLTLEMAGIGATVPPECPALAAAAQKTNSLPELDGPGVVVEIRNGTIHPKEGQRLGAPLVMKEGGDVAIGYLEQLLLNRLGYAGYMCNRAARGRVGPVPWAVQ